MKRLLPLLFLLVMFSCSEETQRRTAGAPRSSVKKNMATFTWVTELCDYQSMYNSDQYTDEQLQHTYALWMDSWYLEVLFLADTPGELQQLSLDSLHQEYKRMAAQLNKLIIVNVPYWQALRQQRLKTMQAEYQLKELAIRAYAQPALLRRTTYDPAGAPYVEALVTADTTGLLRAWQQLHQEEKKQSGLPERLEQEFREKYHSADRLTFARLELMAHGWWHYTKPAVPYIDRDQRMETEFKKLFTNHKVTCGEP